ncbi:MAG: histidinol dehydrogenase [Spirochaetaceae bacterium]|jgi:histidinol dehydrogenase|nr:histidinol dehydrogenase [Spirochaetaceae bacterium]
MQIIDESQFTAWWKDYAVFRREASREAPQEAPREASREASREAPREASREAPVEERVRAIITAVRDRGDEALKDYAAQFDRSSPDRLEVPAERSRAAWENLRREKTELAAALELAAAHIGRFAELQKKQLADFETEIAPGLFTGQRVIPVERAAVYVPAGRFPLFSSVLMGMIPAFTAGVDEVILTSPPMEDGLPDRLILAAAWLSLQTAARAGRAPGDSAGPLRIFAMGGAQAIAALALGTETVPRVSVIAGPGNKYVAAAKRMLSGEVGIDFVAGPTDVLIIADEAPAPPGKVLERIAADMLAQAEHDPDARARALVPRREMAEELAGALERQLAALPEGSRDSARASLDGGGLIIVYGSREGAIRIANTIAPEHLELQVERVEAWTGGLKNFGSLFIGELAAEVLGDYSAGINHTLPTSGGARFTGGLSVRHFLKTPTTLRCVPGPGYKEALGAAEIMGRAEGLAAHARSAAIRREGRQ